MKRLTLQRRAMRDLDAARAWYATNAPHATAGFGLAVDAALSHLREQPATGSPRLGLQLGLAGLRTWPLTRYPYLMLYFNEDEHVTVIRVLHQSQDIPAHLQG